MKASSESGLWATVISRIAVETDGISESYNTLARNADSQHAPVLKHFYRAAANLNRVTLFPPAHVQAGSQWIGFQIWELAALHAGSSGASASARPLRPQPKSQQPWRAPATHIKPS